jgi:hypothetical protein
VITINGAHNGQSGILPVPSALPDSINAFLFNYAAGAISSITSGTGGFADYNPILGSTVNSGGATPPAIFEISNLDSVGASVSGSAASPVTIPSGVTSLWVQLPGDLTVQGSATTNFALFGADSNVTYNVSGGFSSIFAAGGKDLISVDGATASNEYITTGGSDTVYLAGPTFSTGNIDAVGNATTNVFVGDSDNATVTASDSAVASVVFLQNAGGNLDFINNSTQAQTVYSGSYTVPSGQPVYANNAVTAWGGNGGGFFVGGRAGFNYLNGGSGNSTLVGGGANDTLVSGGAVNQLYAGAGSETLVGGGWDNNFYLGLEDVGVGTVKAVGDLVSAGGGGTQNFVLGQSNSTTLTGSTVTGSTNTYDVLGTYTTTGGQATSIQGGDFTITDFGAHDTIWLLNGAYDTGPGAATVETVGAALGGGSNAQILLTDGTIITLKGVSVSQVSIGGGGHQITLH